jgi:hypothetical protein
MEGEEYVKHGSDARGWKKCLRRAEQGKSDDSMTCVWSALSRVLH